jgi:CHAD domain-containing protein
MIRVRLEELRSFADPALQPASAVAQHDMRIAAKRLRYLLELVGFCFGPAAERARRRAKELQAELGDLHDCDVMLPMLEEHGGLDGLATHVEALRGQRFERFTRLWEAIEAEGAWSELERVIDGQLEARRGEANSSAGSATGAVA